MLYPVLFSSCIQKETLTVWGNSDTAASIPRHKKVQFPLNKERSFPSYMQQIFSHCCSAPFLYIEGQGFFDISSLSLIICINEQDFSFIYI